MNGQEHDVRTTLPIFPLIEYRTTHQNTIYIRLHVQYEGIPSCQVSHCKWVYDSGESRISIWGGGLHFGGLGDVTPPKGEGGPGGPPPGKLKKMII